MENLNLHGLDMQMEPRKAKTLARHFFFFKQRQHALSEFCSSKGKYKEKGFTVIKRALSQSECGNVKYNNQGQNPGYNQAMGSYNGAAWT